VNRFTERYETVGHRRIISREGQIFMIEMFVLKKKRECKRQGGRRRITCEGVLKEEH
jgi:hypothetical protein